MTARLFLVDSRRGCVASDPTCAARLQSAARRATPRRRDVAFNATRSPLR